MAIQLNFFHQMTEEEMLKDEFRQLKLTTDKVRKSLYARHAELAKKYMDLHERMDIIERNICRGQ